MKHETDGGRKPRVTDEDLLDVFRQTNDPVLSTAEVADEIPIQRRGTLRRLRSLEADGDLDSKQIGGRNTVWWESDLTTTDADRDTSETGENSPEIDPILDESNGADAVDNDDEPPETDADDADSIAAVVDRVADGWEDNPDRLADRKAAARAVLEYARDHGSVSKQEAKDEIAPEHPVDGQNPRTWYRKNIRPVLKEVAEYHQSKRAHTLDNGLIARAGAELDDEDDQADDNDGSAFADLVGNK